MTDQCEDKSPELGKGVLFAAPSQMCCGFLTSPPAERGVRFLHPPLLRTELCETRVTSLIPLSLPDGLEKHCLNKAYKVRDRLVSFFGS